MPAFLVMIVFIVSSYIFAREITIPKDVVEEVHDGGLILNYNVTDAETDITYQFHKGSFGFGTHIVICTTVVGTILFIFLAGVGFASLPWDIILDYKYRPKPIDEGNFQFRS